MFLHTRTLGSNHGGRNQNGGLGQRRTITPPSQRGVGSRTKEASGAPSRNCSKRSKNTEMRTSLTHQKSSRAEKNDELVLFLFSQRRRWQERQEWRENTRKPEQRRTRRSESFQTSGDESQHSCVKASVFLSHTHTQVKASIFEQRGNLFLNAVESLSFLTLSLPHTYRWRNLILYYIVTFNTFFFLRLDETCSQETWRFLCHHCNSENLCRPKSAFITRSVFSSDNQLIWSISLTSKCSQRSCAFTQQYKH